MTTRDEILELVRERKACPAKAGRANLDAGVIPLSTARAMARDGLLTEVEKGAFSLPVTDPQTAGTMALGVTGPVRDATGLNTEDCGVPESEMRGEVTWRNAKEGEAFDLPGAETLPATDAPDAPARTMRSRNTTSHPVLLACPAHGYAVRTTRKWVAKYGLPTGPCCGKPLTPVRPGVDDANLVVGP